MIFKTLILSILSITPLLGHSNRVAPPTQRDAGTSTTFVRPGADPWSWNGALLGGPRGSLFGVRVGYFEGADYISDIHFYDRVERSGPFVADGSFAELTAQPFLLTWIAQGNDTLIGRVTARRDVAIMIESYPAHDLAFRNRPGSETIPCVFVNPARFDASGPSMVTGNSLGVETIAGTTRVTSGYALIAGRLCRVLPESAGQDHYLLQVDRESLASGPALTPVQGDQGLLDNSRIVFQKFSLKANERLYFMVRVAGRPLLPVEFPTPKVLEKTIAQRQNSYEKNRFQGQGLLGRGAEPMLNELLWLAAYNPYEKTVFLPAGRPWLYDGRYNLWGWDEVFNAIIADLASPSAAAVNLRLAALDERIAPLACWTVYSRHRDLSLLRETYPAFREIYPPDNAEWTGHVGSGMDDTPMRELSLKKGEMDSLDSACMKTWSMEILARMADLLGRPQDAAQYRRSHATLLKRFNESFWNEEAGVYRNRYRSGEWPVTESPTSFYPWLTGAPAQAQSDRLLRRLLDPKKFWGDWVIPTLPRDDPQYGKPSAEPYNGEIFPPYVYWRGNIWAPSNYLVYEGLKRAGHDETAAAFAERSARLWLKHWEKNAWALENYQPETGDRPPINSQTHQSWSMLMPLIGVKELIDVEWWTGDGTLRVGTLSHEAGGIDNYPLWGHRWNVRAGGDRTTLRREGNLLLDAQGAPCVIRGLREINMDDELEIKTAGSLELTLYPPLVAQRVSIGLAPGVSVVKGGEVLTRPSR